MAEEIASSALGAAYLTADGAVEGWCFYRDRPDERAWVELIVNGEGVRSMRATRLRLDRRDLGEGDGYCGFSFPFARPGPERVVVEVREERFQQTLDRLVLRGVDLPRTRRLDALTAALTAIEDGLADSRISPVDVDASAALGRTLLGLASRQGERTVAARLPLREALDDVAGIPALDLGWQAAPKYSVVFFAEGGPAQVGETIRAVARALAGLSVEFILVDDGAAAATLLLPTRLRELVLAPVAPGASAASAYNAAAAAARGEFLAFGRPGGPRPADLGEALAQARRGRLDVASPLPAADGPLAHHGLRCVIAREDFAALGGFDTGPHDHAGWSLLLAKARALGLAISTWNAPAEPAGPGTRRGR